MRRSRGVGQLDQLEQLLSTHSRLGARHPEQPRLQHQELATGLARVEAGFLEGDSDPVSDSVGIGGHVDAGHRCRAGRDRRQRRQHPHRRRFAGTVGTEKAEDLAPSHIEVDPAYGLHRGVRARERLGEGDRSDCARLLR